MLGAIRFAYEEGEDRTFQEYELQEAELELRTVVAESMYALGYAMGPVGRVLAALKDEQRDERRRRKPSSEYAPGSGYNDDPGTGQ